ncbi:hypothetical protein [Zavarzinella formosa]|uniref:hypothetical protein n=1 Tax=Zavarzinella formosa TaxID=360055 RepID=UPI0002D6C990|nr:hypothetical protein [Zavarzinella formosa]
MTDIGELVVRIKADSSQMQSDIKSATDTVKESAGEMSEAMEHVGRVLENFGIVLAAREIIEFGKGALESADNIYILAERIGFAGETLSALNIPLKQNGSSADEFSSSIKFMSRNIELASEGNQELVQRFDSLGLSVTKLKALTPENQFYAIAKALGGVSDQSQFMASGMALLNRSFASLAPLIRSTGGDIEGMTAKAKAMGDALTQDDLDKVHEFEDNWIHFFERFKIEAVEATTAFDDFLKRGKERGDSLPSFADRSDRGIDHFGNKIPGFESWEDKSKRLGMATEAQFVAPGTYDFLNGGKPTAKPSASGSNADLLTADEEREAAEQLGPYIDKLNEEAKAAEVSQKALFVKRTEIEATTKAQNDYNNGLRDDAELTGEETARIDAAAAALYDHKEALAQNKQIADQLTGSLTRIITNFKDMKSAITDLFQSIADEIIKTQIAKPISASITSALPSGGLGGLFSGLGGLLGFADGGSPPVGVPSIVGENGPELFVPSQSGTVIPNSKLGGGGGASVNVYQTFNMQPGLVETVGAAIRQSAPQIAAMAHSSIAMDITNGGPLSRIVGRKS